MGRSVRSQKMTAGGSEGCRKCSALELGVGPGNYVCGNKGKGECLRSAYLFPCMSGLWVNQ